MGGTHSLEDVIASLKRGDMQAFWNEDSIIITEVATTPRAKFLFVFLAAGTLDGCLALRPQLEQFALKVGATFARAQVRPGFAKLLKQHGWRARTVGVEFRMEKADG